MIRHELISFGWIVAVIERIEHPSGSSVARPLDYSSYECWTEKLPKGLRDQIREIFLKETESDPKVVLSKSRDLLEMLMHHLAVAYNLDETGFEPRRKKLQDDNIISKDIAPYFDLWWKLGCLGSHFSKSPISLDWQHHLGMCQRAMVLVLNWYLKTYKEFIFDDNSKRHLLNSIRSISAIDPSKVVLPSLIATPLSTNQATLLLHGPVWSGKTSIITHMAEEFCANGYIPLPFHENTLSISTKTLGIGVGSEGRRTINSFGSALHEFVSTRMFCGNSFVFILDDVFGHRRFRATNLLTRVNFAKLLQLANQPECLGSLVILIATPTEFLEQIREISNSIPNSVVSQNLQALEKNNIEMKISCYSENELSKVVRVTATELSCKWQERDDVCGLVANEIKTFGSFEALRSFCQLTRNAEENELLENAVHFFRERRSLQSELDELSPDFRRFLGAVIVGETIAAFSREFEVDAPMSFANICRVAGCDHLLANPKILADLMRWANVDDAHTLGLTDVYIFKHPEVRSAVEEWMANKHQKVILDLICGICGWTENNEGTLEPWQAIHVICKLARFVDVETSMKIHNDLLMRPVTGIDPRNLLWAIIGNYRDIIGMPFEKYAVAFLKRVQGTIRVYIRPMIHEIADNWHDVSEDVQDIYLDMISRRSDSGHRRLDENEENIMAFIAATIRNFSTICESAIRGSLPSDNCIKLLDQIIVKLAKNIDKPLYPSRDGDRIFDDYPARPTGREVLQRMTELGRRSGGAYGESAIIRTIDRHLH